MRITLVYAGSVILWIISACAGNHRNKFPGNEELLASSLETIAPPASRDTLRTMITKADCISPKGSYTTEVHTTTGGYQLFRQEYSYKPEPFEAILLNDSTGHAGNDTTILPQEAVEMIRGHAFHTILLELRQRYHAYSRSDTLTRQGQLHYYIQAKDRLENPCTLFFDNNTKRLVSIIMSNPGKKEGKIRIEFSGWKQTGAFSLPWQVDIFQGADQFSFHFTSIVINHPEFRKRP